MTKPETIILEGKVQPDRTKTYLMLPFDMPHGVIRIDVGYEYSSAIGSDPHLTGGNTVDIGIFDSRGDSGFRGWSGSARSEFFISTEESTPGYMSGPLQIGIWNICLGLYKIADNGCDYRISIRFTYDELRSGIEFPKQLELSNRVHPGKQESGWYKGDLHCHTHHSDGDSSVHDIVRYAESIGLDFLAITDHNVLSQRVVLRDIKTPLVLIPGTEVTTFRGHWNTWGDGDWVDFRVTTEQEMQQTVDAALAQGYLISCNHPRPYGPEWEYPNIVRFNCIEVWNGPWELMNDVSLAYWEMKLKAGEHYSAVGGSDNHFLKREHHARLGIPTTYIYCEDGLSPASVLAGLRDGHAFITESPHGAKVYLSSGKAMMGDTIITNDRSLAFNINVYDGQNKKLQLCGSNAILREFDINTDEWQGNVELDIQKTLYIRAQLISNEATKQRIHVLTNPIYIQWEPD